MITKALQLFGKNEIKQEEIVLPEINDNELLMEVVVNALKKVDREQVSGGEDVPYIIGCEFGGKVIGIGKNLVDQYKIRDRIAIIISDDDRKNPAFRYVGGCSQFVIIPASYIQAGKVITYNHSAFYYGALVIPTAAALAEGRKNGRNESGQYSLADIKAAAAYAAEGVVEPALFVSHIGGFDSEAEEILKTENGLGQKIFYSHLSLPLTAISSFGSSKNPLLTALHEICREHNGLWSPEAEEYLLNHAARI